MDLENLSCGHITCAFTWPNLSYADGHILHLVQVFSGERSRAIMALLFSSVKIQLKFLTIKFFMNHATSIKQRNKEYKNVCNSRLSAKLKYLQVQQAYMSLHAVTSNLTSYTNLTKLYCLSIK